MEENLTPEEVGIELARGRLVSREALLSAFPDADIPSSASVCLNGIMNLKSLYKLFVGGEYNKLFNMRIQQQLAECWGANLIYHYSINGYDIKIFLLQFGLIPVGSKFDRFELTHNDDVSFLLTYIVGLSTKASVIRNTITKATLVEKLEDVQHFNFSELDFGFRSTSRRDLVISLLCLRYVLQNLTSAKSIKNLTLPPLKLKPSIYEILHRLNTPHVYCAPKEQLVILEAPYGSCALFFDKAVEIKPTTDFYHVVLKGRLNQEETNLVDDIVRGSNCVPAVKKEFWLSRLTAPRKASKAVMLPKAAAFKFKTIDLLFRVINGLPKIGVVEFLDCTEKDVVFVRYETTSVLVLFWLVLR